MPRVRPRPVVDITASSSDAKLVREALSQRYAPVKWVALALTEGFAIYDARLELVAFASADATLREIQDTIPDPTLPERDAGGLSTDDIDI